jgi:hypothetical protein
MRQSRASCSDGKLQKFRLGLRLAPHANPAALLTL